MPRKAAIYIYVLVLAALPLLYGFSRDLTPTQWPLLLGMAALTVVFDLLRVESPNGQSLTLNSAVKIAAILVGGPALAVWVAGVGEFSYAMTTGYDYRRTAFNTAQMVVTVGIAGTVFQLLSRSAALSSSILLPATAAILVYFIVNSTLMALLFSFLRGEPPAKLWLGMVKEGVEAYLTVQILGLIATFLIVSGGPVWAFVLLALLLLLQRVLSRYYGALRRNMDSTRHEVVQDSLLNALVAALDARDIHAAGHSSRVARYADLIAEQLRFTPEERKELKYASILHDVGKLGMPDSVLRKNGPLSPTERALMMEHPERGIRILGQMPDVPSTVLEAVKHHHEWYNGGGYPDGLGGERIPLNARIIAIADAFDAMTSARPYRDGMPWAEAINRLKQGRGSQFDPRAAEAMLEGLARNPNLEQELVGESRAMLSRLERQVEQEQRSMAAAHGTGRILPVHSKEIEIIYRLALERRSLLDLSQTLHRLLEILYDAVGPNLYYILLLDDSNHLVIRSVAGASVDLSQIRWPLDQGEWAEMLQRQQPTLIADAEHAQQTFRANPWTRSLVTVPLVSENKAIGALRVESTQLNAFGQDELYLLTAVARQLADAIEVARAHDLLAFAASHDGLTGALNRAGFYSHLADELAKAERQGYEISVAVLDINNFKAINDTYGHLAGDRTMQAFGKVLRERLRQDDIYARYGGDEFAIILPRAPREEAARLIETIATHAGTHIAVGEECVPLPTASWGVATYPLQGSTAEELVAAADQSMYRRKRGLQYN